MIPVTPKPPPPDSDFDAQVATPGANALLELIGDPAAPSRPGPPRKIAAPSIDRIPQSKLPPYWRRALPLLLEAYNETCAYLGLRIHPATGAAEVDHFLPKSKYQHLAYRWENFRLSCKQANANKGNAEDVLDPFTIGSGWFSLNLLSGEVEVGAGANHPSLRTQVETTIQRLKLNDDPTFVAARREYINLYFGVRHPDGLPCLPPMDFRRLEREAPFVAAEINRQGKRRP